MGGFMIKAAFFDFDGTILSHTTGIISESTKYALMQLRKKGIRIYLATGRHILAIQELMGNQITFDGYITLNGQLCLNKNKDVIFDFPIDEKDLNIMVSIFESKEIPIMFVEQRAMYINYINNDVVKTQKAISTPNPDVGKYSGEKVYQFIVYDDGKIVNKLMEELPNCKMSRWNKYAVDIINQIGGKVTGIQYFLNSKGILPSEIVAFGDGENDIAMLDYAGIGIAMGNADKEIKEAADYVTTHIDDNGIINGLYYLGLI